MEVWKDVIGYEGLYEVSNLGNVRNVKRNRVLKPLKRNHGYLAVQLHGRGGNERGFRTFSIHRIVAESFVPNPRGLTEINHIDEDKTNNNCENLEWVTHKENMNRGTVPQRFKSMKNHVRPILQFDKTGNLIAEYESAREAERQTGISHKSIFNSLSRGHYCKGYMWQYR